MHHRFAPKAHRFVYGIFLLAIDLDELGDLHRRVPFFSVNRANLYSFREADYLPTGETQYNAASGTAPAPGAPTSLKARVTAYMAERGVDLTGGRIVLITMPRVLGYLFNPVSFYFCYDRTGAPVAAITEVTNTFHEMKPYFLGPDTKDQKSEASGQKSEAESARFRLRTPKYFYVSPYSDVDVDFDFVLRSPGDRLSVQIDDYSGAARMLTSTLTGPRRELTGGRLAWFAVKYPALTLKVITMIHWHAFRLWLKRVPWFAKAARAADQRALYRPHTSIASAKTAVSEPA